MKTFSFFISDFSDFLDQINRQNQKSTCRYRSSNSGKQVFFQFFVRFLRNGVFETVSNRFEFPKHYVAVLSLHLHQLYIFKNYQNFRENLLVVWSHWCIPPCKPPRKIYIQRFRARYFNQVDLF